MAGLWLTEREREGEEEGNKGKGVWEMAKMWVCGIESGREKGYPLVARDGEEQTRTDKSGIK